MDIFKKKIVLASGSPRRYDILQRSGFSFRVQVSHVREDFPAHLTESEVPVYLAEKKARSILPSIHKEEIIIAADSTVWLGDQLFEKPEDAQKARAMLKALSGKMHKVITGVCLLSQQKKSSFHDLTTVRFAPLNDEEIQYYITHYQPFDKAGSYGIQEWLGDCKIESIQGSYVNVMGLPMAKVYKALNNF